tara:strand:+ start:442 stop:642 length:201 start_codon:yes stop_codon:yes gene_type:complete
MTRETLQQIIDDNIGKATYGDLFAISNVVNAQDELKKIDQFENQLNLARASQLANQAMGKMIPEGS